MASARAQRQLKRGLKKIHPATKAIAILFLVIGIAAGALFSLYTFQNDRFLLKGESSFSIDVGETYTYTEQGVDAQWHCYGTEEQEEIGHVFHVNIILPEARQCNDDAALFFAKYV